jgi:hypothetical protein
LANSGGVQQEQGSSRRGSSRLRAAVVAALLALVVGAAVIAAPSLDLGGLRSSLPLPGGVETTSVPQIVAGPLPSGWQRGANLTAYSAAGYGTPAGLAELERLRMLGVDHVALVPLWYMDTGESVTIAPDPGLSSSDAALLEAASEAKRLGLEVAIAPHVDVRDGTFRGGIQPADPRAWFASYRAFLDHYASLATEAGADELVTGTELTSTSTDEAAWRRLIAGARSRFDGTLTYAANWVDEAEQIRFWDALDEIGINAYMPLGEPEPLPAVDQLVADWQPYVQRISALHDGWGKPIVFTELGYQSREGTAAAGGTPATGATSEAAQATAYEAAYRAWQGPSWFRGIWWWDWSVDGGDPDGAGFSPEGKLAEDVVASWNRAG